MRALVLIIIILFGAVKLNTKYIYLISHVSADYWVVDIPGTHKQRYRSTDSDKIVDNIIIHIGRGSLFFLDKAFKLHGLSYQGLMRCFGLLFQ